MQKEVRKQSICLSLSGTNVTDGGVDVWGTRNEGTNTSKTQAPMGVSSDTSRLFSYILRGRRLEESLSHRVFEVLHRLLNLRVDFGRERVVAAQIFLGIFRPRLGGWARRGRWWEGMGVKEIGGSRVIGPGSVAPTRATKSHTHKITENGWDFYCTLGVVCWTLWSQSSGLWPRGLAGYFEEPWSGEIIWVDGLSAFHGICLFPRFVSSCSPLSTASHEDTDTLSS